MRIQQETLAQLLLLTYRHTDGDPESSDHFEPTEDRRPRSTFSKILPPLQVHSLSKQHSCLSSGVAQRKKALANLEEQGFGQGPTKGRTPAALSHRAYQKNFRTTYLTWQFASIATAWQTWKQGQMLSPRGLWTGKAANKCRVNVISLMKLDFNWKQLF